MASLETDKYAGLLAEGGEIWMRYARETDLEPYLRFLGDPEMTRLTGSQNEPTRDQIVAWIKKIGAASDDRVDWMILSKATNELLGEVVLNEIDTVNRSANIRIGIQGTQHRGKGYGTEAMLCMLRHGFHELKLHRIHLGVYAFNPRAIRVYEKLGFVREGVERDSLWLDGKFHDLITMSILEDEFRALHER